MARLTAREPLTRTEAETLAVMIDSGARRMSTARDLSGIYFVWAGDLVSDAYDDMFAAFYQLMDQDGLRDVELSA